MLAPGIPTLKHAKKCVFGVFLNLTRIALVRKNLVIDIILEGIEPTLNPPRGGVATGLENNCLFPDWSKKLQCFSGWIELEMIVLIQ